jgi:hypothetical protein
MITLRLGRKPINGAAGRLGPPTSAVAKSAGHAERRTNHGLDGHSEWPLPGRPDDPLG